MATKKAAPAKRPATKFTPAGAPIRPSTEVDPKHPAVDADPRAGTSEQQNRIDFNDPTKSGSEAVAANLAAQKAE
ncbi:MAG: hypothetical protein EOP24_27710 [Hyphomicrobiales bacterium]|nr:MAG: hypothetical protein EOP24_27710 [Hyphomicrobiales bacterium]